MDIFQTIKRLVLRGKILFTRKAEEEMAHDELNEVLVREAIVNAPRITKRLRSRDRSTGRREKLYVIVGKTFDGVVIYTKGKIEKVENGEFFYVLISSKKSIN